MEVVDRTMMGEVEVDHATEQGLETATKVEVVLTRATAVKDVHLTRTVVLNQSVPGDRIQRTKSVRAPSV